MLHFTIFIRSSGVIVIVKAKANALYGVHIGSAFTSHWLRSAEYRYVSIFERPIISRHLRLHRLEENFAKYDRYSQKVIFFTKNTTERSTEK